MRLPGIFNGHPPSYVDFGASSVICVLGVALSNCIIVARCSSFWRAEGVTRGVLRASLHPAPAVEERRQPDKLGVELDVFAEEVTSQTATFLVAGPISFASKGPLEHCCGSDEHGNGQGDLEFPSWLARVAPCFARFPYNEPSGATASNGDKDDDDDDDLVSFSSPSLEVELSCSAAVDDRSPLCSMGVLRVALVVTASEPSKVVRAMSAS